MLSDVTRIMNVMSHGASVCQLFTWPVYSRPSPQKNRRGGCTQTIIYCKIARKFNSTNVLHFPIEHAVDVNKLFLELL